MSRLPPSICRTALVAALVAGAPAALAQGGPGGGFDESELFLSGLTVDPHPGGGLPELLQFEVLRADTTVVLTPIGRVPFDAGPLAVFSEFPAPPDSAVPLRISAASLRSIAEGIEEILADDPPPDRFGFSIDDGRLRIEWARGVPLLTLALMALALVVGSGGATAFALRRRGRRQEREALEHRRRQIEAEEAERARIAREIHDGPLQDLHAVRARAGLPDAPDVSGDLGRVAHELRSIAEGLRPPALGRFGLPAALTSHASRLTGQHGVRVRVRADEDAPPLAPAAEASLFRIAQEAVTNALRHGHARSVEVVYAVVPSPDAPDHVRLEVRDDGDGLPGGFDPDALATRGHFGLAGMQERASLLGGTLTVTGEGLRRPGAHREGPAGGADRGTAVRAVVPWATVAVAPPTGRGS